MLTFEQLRRRVRRGRAATAEPALRPPSRRPGSPHPSLAHGERAATPRGGSPRPAGSVPRARSRALMGVVNRTTSQRRPEMQDINQVALTARLTVDPELLRPRAAPQSPPCGSRSSGPGTGARRSTTSRSGQARRELHRVPREGLPRRHRRSPGAPGVELRQRLDAAAQLRRRRAGQLPRPPGQGRAGRKP